MNPPTRTADLVALTKPSITRMCLLMAGGGMALAPMAIDWLTGISAFVGIALAVGGANAFNMWWERNTDGLMSRTKRRPLPTGRLSAATAFKFAAGLSLASLVVLALGTNMLTAVLAGLAIFSYVAIYTPLKYKTPSALIIGAIPGAAPPLLGWTAVTGSIDPPAMVLFAILLVWQLPHFIAIAIYRKQEYARAGIKVVPLVRGEPIAKIQAVAWVLVLVPLTLMLAPVAGAGLFYFVSAALLGAAFLGWSFTGLDNDAGVRWARNYFLASLVYLPALTLALVADVFL
ncbi:MAG: heme o synthase [Nannocystaceae bacterium]|nr:heme o synthase [Nannocystaceae bacterium]